MVGKVSSARRCTRLNSLWKRRIRLTDFTDQLSIFWFGGNAPHTIGTPQGKRAPAGGAAALKAPAALGPVDGFAGVKSRGFPNRVLFESLRDRHEGAGHADENDGARLVDRAGGV